MEICTEIVRVTTTGANGAAVGNAKSVAMMGFLLDISLDFNVAAPATTDTTVALDSGETVLTVSNSVTDVLIAPRQKVVDSANAAIANGYDRFPLNGAVSISLAQCNALTDALVAKIRYLRL